MSDWGFDVWFKAGNEFVMVYGQSLAVVFACCFLTFTFWEVKANIGLLCAPKRSRGAHFHEVCSRYGSPQAC